jgi:hypothetical protein
VTPERWVRIQTIFARIVELAPEARASRLAATCGEEPDLRREIEALLAADRAARDGWSIKGTVARTLREFLE